MKAMRIHQLWFLVWVAAGWGAWPANNALAQQTTPDTGRVTLMLEEVVVTARRKEESLQAVPIAVTALTGADIDRNRISQINDLQHYVPSLRQYFGKVDRNSDQVSLRSLPGVLTYFSEAPASALGPGRFFDLANIQVLKGPQGTLFGGTSTGGAILVQPRKPDNKFGGYLRGAIGDYSNHELEGAVNFPVVSDVLKVRVAFNRQSRDGYTKDVGPFFHGKRYDDRDNWSVRLGVIFEPFESFSNYLVYDQYRRHNNGTGIKMIDYNPNGPAVFVYGDALRDAVALQRSIGPRKTTLSANSVNKAQECGITDVAEWAVTDHLTVRNVASYRSDKILNRYEFEGTPLPILDQVTQGWSEAHRSYSEEFQIQGKLFENNLDWTVGFFLEDVKPIDNPSLEQITFGAPPSVNASVQSSNQKAYYAQGTYDLGSLTPALQNLSFTAGVRKSSDETLATNNQYKADGSCTSRPGYTFPDCEVKLKARDDEVTWTFALNYQVADNLMTYITARKGYRPGSFNFYAPTPELARVDPEFAEDVEVGLKADWSFRGVQARTNVDYYHIKYTDIQRAVGYYDPATNVQGYFTQNAAEATAQGVEFEGELVYENLQMSLSYAWSDAKYDEFTSQTPTGPVDFSGIPFPSSPKNKFSTTASYSLQLPSSLGELVPSITYSWQSSFWGLSADRQPYSRLPEYGLLDIRLDWHEVAGAPVSIAAFVTNATDETTMIAGGGVWDVLGYVPAIYNEPRMYGIEFRYRFGASAP